MLAFLDIETTGLNRTKDHILEVAFIFTDDELELKGVIRQVVRPVGLFSWDDMDPVVRSMHIRNGLIDEVEREGVRRYEAEAKLLEFARRIPSGTCGSQLAGNSVWWDYEWLREHMPWLARHFDRRVVDVTALNQLAQRWAPKLYAGRPRPSSRAGTHRALDDAAESLETLKYYRKNGLFVGPEEAAKLEREECARLVEETHINQLDPCYHLKIADALRKRR